MLNMHTMKATRRPVKRKSNEEEILYKNHIHREEEYQEKCVQKHTRTNQAINNGHPLIGLHVQHQGSGIARSGPRDCAQGSQQCGFSGHRVGYPLGKPRHQRDHNF